MEGSDFARVFFGNLVFTLPAALYSRVSRKLIRPRLILEKGNFPEQSAVWVFHSRSLQDRRGQPEQCRDLGAHRIAEIDGVTTDLGALRHGLWAAGAGDRRFRIGPRALRLGYSALVSLNIRQRARQPMQDLASQASVSVSLGLRQGIDMLYVEQARGAAALSTRLTVGDRSR